MTNTSSLLRALIAGIRETFTHRGDPPCDYAGDGRPCLGRRDAARVSDAGKPTRRACRTHTQQVVAEATALITTCTDPESVKLTYTQVNPSMPADEWVEKCGVWTSAHQRGDCPCGTPTTAGA